MQSLAQQCLDTAAQLLSESWSLLIPLRGCLNMDKNENLPREAGQHMCLGKGKAGKTYALPSPPFPARSPEASSRTGPHAAIRPAAGPTDTRTGGRSHLQHGQSQDQALTLAAAAAGGARKRSSGVCRMARREGGLPVTLLLCCPASTAARSKGACHGCGCAVPRRATGPREAAGNVGMHLPECNGRAACAAFPPLCLPAPMPPPAGTAPGGRSQELGQQVVLPSPPQTYPCLQQSSGPVSSACGPLPGAAQTVAACCTISHSAQPCLLPSGWIRAVQKEKKNHVCSQHCSLSGTMGWGYIFLGQLRESTCLASHQAAPPVVLPGKISPTLCAQCLVHIASPLLCPK